MTTFSVEAPQRPAYGSVDVGVDMANSIRREARTVEVLFTWRYEPIPDLFLRYLPKRFQLKAEGENVAIAVLRRVRQSWEVDEIRDLW